MTESTGIVAVRRRTRLSPAKDCDSPGAREEGKQEGNGGGGHGPFKEQKMEGYHGFKRRRWRSGDHGHEDTGSSLEEDDEMTSSLASQRGTHLSVSPWEKKERGVCFWFFAGCVSARLELGWPN